jgi:hypothetical protein
MLKGKTKEIMFTIDRSHEKGHEPRICYNFLMRLGRIRKLHEPLSSSGNYIENF